MNTTTEKKIYQVAWHEETKYSPTPAYYRATDRDDAWRQFDADPGPDKTDPLASGDARFEDAPRSNFTIEIATSRWWSVSDGFDLNGEELSPDPAEALKQAIAIVRGNMGELDYTVGDTHWLSVQIRSTNEAYDELIAINPTPPGCVNGHEHEWHAPFALVGGVADNPGVFSVPGSSGTITKEVCKHCNCGKSTNTGARNPNTGHQNLTSVSYSDFLMEDPPEREASDSGSFDMEDIEDWQNEGSN